MSLRILGLLTVMLTSTLLSCVNTESNTKAEHAEMPVAVSVEDLELFNLLKAKDSLLFQVGFNQIDTAQVAELASADFEFYHDEHGITETKSAFVSSINGIGDLPFKTWRILVNGSLEVFPLYKNNSQDLYGAIQNGVHEFYQQHDGEEARKTNIAKFTHLWIIEDGDWRLKRVLSYDHQVPK